MTIITPWQWVLALVVGVLFFIVFSAGYGFFVYTRPAKIISSITPADLGLEFEKASIITSDNLKLAAWYILSKKETNKAILLLHGYPADKGDILSSMSFLASDYNLLLIDFRYFGDSEGNYSTVGIRETEDVLAAVRFLKERGNEQVGAWGFSAGAASALMALSQSSDINAVVSESSYASLELMTREVYPVPVLNNAITWLTKGLAKVFLDVDIKKESPLLAVKNTMAPILFIHSQDDTVIPFYQAQLLKQASSKNRNAEFWFRESLGHGYIGSDEYNRRVGEFFKNNL